MAYSGLSLSPLLKAEPILVSLNMLKLICRINLNFINNVQLNYEIHSL